MKNNNFMILINQIKNGWITPIFFILTIVLPQTLSSQYIYSSFGQGTNQSYDKIVQSSLTNFFDNNTTTLDPIEIENIISNFGDTYFKTEKVFDQTVNDNNIILVKTTLIQNSIIKVEEDFLGLAELNFILEKSEYNKKIINNSFEEIISNLNIEDVFDFNFELSKRKIDTQNSKINIEIKSDFVLSDSFENLIDGIISLLNQLKLDQKEIDLIVENEMELFPSIILSNNNFSGFFSTNDLQYNLLLLVDRINKLIKNHNIFNNLGMVRKPSSYINGNSKFFTNYLNKSWQEFGFQIEDKTIKTVGSNFIESKVENQLLNYFSSNVLLNQNCLISDFDNLRGLIVKKTNKLFFPLSILSLKCNNEVNPIITYFYKFEIPLEKAKMLNANFKISSDI